MITEIIGSNIKKHREKNKMSQKKLAALIGVTRPVISNWENGKSEPSSSQLLKLSNSFMTTSDDILGKTSKKKE